MIKEIAFADVQHEMDNTRRILERIPENLTFQPHTRSGTLGNLAQHVATLPSLFERVASVDEVDLMKWQRPPQLDKASEILALFDESRDKAMAALEKMTDDDLSKTWTLRMGEQVIFSMPRFSALRTFAISHIVHHRAQLSVYLRLLDVPVPGLYGPSADEK